MVPPVVLGHRTDIEGYAGNMEVFIHSISHSHMAEMVFPSTGEWLAHGD